jgi:hypothetical protein
MSKRKRYDPFAPLTPKQQRQLARRYANAQFGPVLAQINAEYARRARSGGAAISAGTEQLAGQLAPEQGRTHEIYAAAQAAQDSLDQAIAAKLSGAGQAASGDVNKQLDAAGIPRAASPDLAQMGAGAGAASFGIGSAALSRLVGQGAAAENYAGKLPALARLGGAQKAQDLALQLEHGRQTDVGNLRSKIPGAVSQIEQDIGNRELQKGIAVQSGLVAGAKLDASAAATNARLQTTQRGQDLSHQDRQASIAARKAAAHDAQVQKHTQAFWKIRSKAFTDAKTLYKGQSGNASGDGSGILPGATATYERVPAQQAYRRLYGNYAPQLRALGYTPAAIQQMVTRAMHFAGYGKFNVPGSKPKGSTSQSGGSFGGPGGR